MKTAEEILKKYYREAFSEKDVLGFRLKNAMIEFAQLHVKRALKTAYKNAKLKTFYDPDDEVPYESVVKESILNCYPDKLII